MSRSSVSIVRPKAAAQGSADSWARCSGDAMSRVTGRRSLIDVARRAAAAAIRRPSSDR